MSGGPQRHRVVTPDEFPHGLRCAVCGESIPYGELYAVTPDEPIRGIPCFILVCLDHEGERPDEPMPTEMRQDIEASMMIEEVFDD